MTQNEWYRFNEGYERAMRYVQRQIDILKKSDTNSTSLMLLEMNINTAMHMKQDVDNLGDRILRKIDVEEEENA